MKGAANTSQHPSSTKLPRERLYTSHLPNGRAKFANRDFGCELRVICRKVTFSATTYMQMKPLVRAIRRFERKIPRDKDSVAEGVGFEFAEKDSNTLDIS